VAAMFLYSKSLASINNYQAFLNSRNYNYSVVIDKSLDTNCYALYNKIITFSKNESLNSTINAVTLMETGSSHNDEDFIYDYVCELKENEILISLNIAINNKIKVGSIIYSRSKITTSVDSYVVKGLIPDIYGINENDTNMDKGIIVVGKSEEYLNNIQTDYIYFYNTDFSKINQQGANITGALNSVEKTKVNLIKNHVFFSSVTCGLLVAITSVMAVVLMSFNIGVYLKKKEYGVQSLNKIIITDLLAYFIMIIVGVCFAYGILSMITRFAFESILSFLTISIIVFASSYLIVKKRMNRR
jgi:hypothetical protein